MKRFAITIAFTLLAAGGAFLLGWATATFGTPSDQIFITDTWSIRPDEQPVAHGVFYAACVTLLAFALLLAIGLTWLFIRFGVLFHVVAVGLTGSGLFGGRFGVSGDQRGSMAIVAVTLGGMGALMCVALLKERLRRPQK